MAQTGHVYGTKVELKGERGESREKVAKKGVNRRYRSHNDIKVAVGREWARERARDTETEEEWQWVRESVRE